MEDKTGEEKNNQDATHRCTCMDGMTRARRDLSQRCDVTPLCINGRRAVCSVLRVVHVHVRDGVLVVHRIVLKHDVVMRKVVRNGVAII